MFPSLPRRRSKCLVLLVVFLLIQYLIVLLVHSESDFTNIQEINILDDISKTKQFYKNIFTINKDDSTEEAATAISDKLKSLAVSESGDYHKFWKFHNQLTGHYMEISPKDYEKERQSHYHYDPRITYTVYLNHIRKKFQSLNPYNEIETIENGIEHIKVPFSWTDWLDLSVLNKYLDYSDEEKPTCETIMNLGLGYDPNNKDHKANNLKSKQKNKPLDDTCVDMKNYKGPRTDKLLPGFAFCSRTKKKTFLEKMLHSKSYMSAYAPIPASLFFISPKGSYEVLTDVESSIVDSGLFEEYLEDQNYDPETQEKIAFDATVEFSKLMKTVPGRKTENDYDNILNVDNQFQFQVPMESFKFDHKPIIEEYERRITNGETLTNKELNHYNSLLYSLSIPAEKLPKYHHEVNINWPAKHQGHVLKENGGHYDWRFFNGFISESQINEFDAVDEKRRIILHRMLHAWLSFTYREGIITWLAHGSLLGWYWDGLSFVWDNDIDVQMPITELDKFALKYNNSLIIDNLENSYAKFYVDCGSFTTHRLKGNGRNNIDARFIDVDSGFYIDITALALSDSPNLPPRYIRDLKDMGEFNKKSETKEISEIKEVEKPGSLVKRASGTRYRNTRKKAEATKGTEEGLRRNTVLQAYNCRNNHFYRYHEISPLVFSMMEGAPAFIPKNFEDILTTEYKNGLTATIFNKHFYMPDFRLWIPLDKFQQFIRFKLGKGLRNNQIPKFVSDNSEEIMLALLEDEEILKEFFFTERVTKLHEDEMTILKKLRDPSPSEKDIKAYQNLVSKFRLMEPLRKDQFVYISEVLALGRGETLTKDMIYNPLGQGVSNPSKPISLSEEEVSYNKKREEGFYFAKKLQYHNPIEVSNIGEKVVSNDEELRPKDAESPRKVANFRRLNRYREAGRGAKNFQNPSKVGDSGDS